MLSGVDHEVTWTNTRRGEMRGVVLGPVDVVGRHGVGKQRVTEWVAMSALTVQCLLWFFDFHSCWARDGYVCKCNIYSPVVTMKENLRHQRDRN